MVFATVAGAAVAPESAMPLSTMIPAILFYGAAAAWFIWMGVGSILARRWAYKLLLVTSWLWLVCGTGGMIAWLILVGDIYGGMVQQEGLSEDMVRILQVVTSLFLLVIYIIAPAVLVLFYRSRHVRATCEALDPVERWTDRCPSHPLALTLVFWMFAGSMLMMAAYNFALPFFGTIVSGLTGACVVAILCGLSAWVGWSIYKLRPAGWLAALVLALAYGLSLLVTFARVSLMDYYRAMNMPEEQLKYIETMNVELFSSPLSLLMVLYLTAFVAYVIYTKRYFPAAPATLDAA
jgi:hypothetical protein